MWVQGGAAALHPQFCARFALSSAVREGERAQTQEQDN